MSSKKTTPHLAPSEELQEYNYFASCNTEDRKAINALALKAKFPLEDVLATLKHFAASLEQAISDYQKSHDALSLGFVLGQLKELPSKMILNTQKASNAIAELRFELRSTPSFNEPSLD